MDNRIHCLLLCGSIYLWVGLILTILTSRLNPEDHPTLGEYLTCIFICPIAAIMVLWFMIIGKLRKK